MTARIVKHSVHRPALAKALASGSLVTAYCGRSIRPLPAEKAEELPLCSRCEQVPPVLVNGFRISATFYRWAWAA